MIYDHSATHGVFDMQRNRPIFDEDSRLRPVKACNLPLWVPSRPDWDSRIRPQSTLYVLRRPLHANVGHTPLGNRVLVLLKCAVISILKIKRLLRLLIPTDARIPSTFVLSL